MAKIQRTFIAVSIPEPVVHFLQDVQRRLRPLLPDVRCVAVGNIHLTLKFLGEIDPGQNSKIAGQIEEAALHASPFSLTVKGVGAFPNRRQARGLVDWTRRRCGSFGFDSGRFGKRSRIHRISKRSTCLLPASDHRPQSKANFSWQHRKGAGRHGGGYLRILHGGTDRVL